MDSKVAGEEDGPLLVAGEEDDPLLVALHELNDSLEHTKKTLNSPALNYLRDVRAMAATPADVKELVNAYLFIIDVPGVGYSDIKVDVQLEDDCVLVISGERWREEDELEEKYELMERWMGKLMQKFKLPENANTDAVSALCKDGVLTVTVEKLPAPAPKKVKSIQVKTA